MALLAVQATATRSLKQSTTSITPNRGGIYNLPPPSFVQPASITTLPCVKTPAEYVEAFAKRQPRCVSNDLISRISQGYNPSTKLGFPLDVSKRAANFFTGSDALEKFLLIGFPATIGNFVGNQSDSNFPGLQEISNGQAFLEAIGYSASEVDISSLYTLNVLSRNSIRKVVRSPVINNFTAFEANIPPIRPTWDVVRDFMEDTFQWQGLNISDGALAVLDSKNFKTLTACPSECAFSPVDFPSVNSTRAVVRGTRTGPQTCSPPTDVASDWVQVEPTALDAASTYCNDLWQKYYVSFSFVFCSQNERKK